MYRISKVCITNRHLVNGDYMTQMKKVLATSPKAVILREKDLSAQEYEQLAMQVMDACEECGVTCILHSFTDVAKRLGSRNIHLSVPAFLSLTSQEREYFSVIGVSTHSVEEAVEAQKLGATYVTASHVFATDCKKGLAPRGLGFLREVCESVSIPVYALGGISEENAESCVRAGAAGVCMMSEFMRMP